MVFIVVRLDSDLAVTHHGPFPNRAESDAWVRIQDDTVSIFTVEPLYDPREGVKCPVG